MAKRPDRLTRQAWARIDGQRAHIMGCPLDSNPYGFGEFGGGRAWESGWMQDHGENQKRNGGVCMACKCAEDRKDPPQAL